MHAAKPADPAPATIEAGLVRGLQRSEHDCLAVLMDRHGEDLMRYLHSLLLRREDAEDIFQECWVRVYQHARRCDPDRPFAPWLFRIARNLAYDHWRWRRRWRALLGSEAPADLPEPSIQPRTAEVIASADLTHRLLGGLAPTLREVIHLRFWADCSYEEIAAIAGVPTGTVKSRLHRALARLGHGARRLEVRHAATVHV